LTLLDVKNLFPEFYRYSTGSMVPKNQDLEMEKIIKNSKTVDNNLKVCILM
jgi:hypothetical protein